MWKAAIEDAINKTRINMDRFGDLFPHVSQKDKYQLNANIEWTDGFWSGILWLCYEYSGEEKFLIAARKTVDSFRDRLATNTNLEHHDIGFLYSLSSKAQWMIEGEDSSRVLTIAAADALMKRWRPKAQILQAWGPEGHEQNGGRIIIDCLMNLPLLYWAHKVTGDQRY